MNRNRCFWRPRLLAAAAQCWTPVANTFAVFNLPPGYDGYATTTGVLWFKVTSNGSFTKAQFDAKFGIGPVIDWFGVVFALSAQAAADYIASAPSSPVLQTYGGGYSTLTGVWVSDTQYLPLFGPGEGLSAYASQGVDWNLAKVGQQYPYLPSCS